MASSEILTFDWMREVLVCGSLICNVTARLCFGVWGFGLPVGSVAIGALLRGIRYLWMRKGCTMGD